MPSSPAELFLRMPPPVEPGWEGVRVLSIGHSTLPLEEFLLRLKAHGVATVADVRRFPGSRRYPWFNAGALSASLWAAGIAYAHVEALGGRRSPSDLPRSTNGAWRNESFHAFADHMQTAEFRAGREALRALAHAGPVALLCAEALPWRCHRSLVSDALFARGVVVRHVSDAKTAADHVPPAHAVLRGIDVTYPASATADDEGDR
jgi:uncharacterized protein (DUF488 family)